MERRPAPRQRTTSRQKALSRQTPFIEWFHTRKPGGGKGWGIILKYFEARRSGKQNGKVTRNASYRERRREKKIKV